jgi:hypothetical protein
MGGTAVGGKMDDDLAERLTALERKLDFLKGAVLVLLGLVLAIVVYFCLRAVIGLNAAFVGAVLCGWAVPHLMDIWFHSRR